MRPAPLASVRKALVTAGVLVWVPYMVARYALHRPFPAWWILAVHIPCMAGALGLRLRQVWIGRRKPETPPTP